MRPNSSHPILAKEGWGIIGASIFVALLVWLLFGGFISFLCFVLLAFVIQFFRDPPRAVSQTPHAVLAGADGRICKIQKCINPYTGKEEMLISTFMNVFNVHSNYCPVGGKVEAIEYIPGSFVNADLDKASEQNERNAVVVKSEEGPVITFVQIAGLVARRILCHLHVGEEVERGQRYGFIRFGSRVDIYVPLNSEVLVFVGQKVRATDTVIALLNPEKLEEPVQGQPVPELEASEKVEIPVAQPAQTAEKQEA